MLGATGLSDAANAVLVALENDTGAESLGKLCATLNDNLSRLIEGIRLHAVAEPPESAQTLAPARFAEILARLGTLLDQGDLAASYLAKEESDLLVTVLGESAKTLHARIEAFDYEAAGSILREFRLHSHETA